MAAYADHLRYDTGARFFHWLIALLMVGMYVSDWTRGALERGSPERAFALATHMSLGISVFIITLLRLFWRLRHRAPAPAGRSALVAVAANAGHFALYLATLGLPVSGVLRAMSSGKDIHFFGITIPPLITPSDGLREMFTPLHDGLVMNLLLALVAVHVLAALWHQFILKDGTLRRMA